MWKISKAVWPPGLKWRAWEVCDIPPISLHLPTENMHALYLCACECSLCACLCGEEREAMLALKRLFGIITPSSAKYLMGEPSVRPYTMYIYIYWKWAMYPLCEAVVMKCYVVNSFWATLNVLNCVTEDCVFVCYKMTK